MHIFRDCYLVLELFEALYPELFFSDSAQFHPRLTEGAISKEAASVI